MRNAKWALLVVAIAPLAGCKSTGSTGQSNQPVIRSSGETAPADIQLACASEAATRLNQGKSVLPVSSLRAPDGSYHVGLQLSAGQAMCVIGANGAIQSLNPV